MNKVQSSKFLQAMAASTEYRPSASVIITAKKEPVQHADAAYDYDVLLIKRTAATAYAPNHCVFPGGCFEVNSDESVEWLHYFKACGLSDEHIQALRIDAPNRPEPLLTSGVSMERDISLRITAIRETFEEVGVLLCRSIHTFAHNSPPTVSGSIRSDFDRVYWQRAVHENAANFLKLCRTLRVVPDLWAVSEWSVWRSPTTASKKYDIVFYFVTLGKRPELMLETSEVADAMWLNPLELLLNYKLREIWLPPQLFYELSRLANAPSSSELQRFARLRNQKGSTLLMPVYYRCVDGLVGTLPGDEFYPTDPETLTETVEVTCSIKEFRDRAQRQHRLEFNGMHDLHVQLNIPAIDAHLSPLWAVPDTVSKL